MAEKKAAAVPARPCFACGKERARRTCAGCKQAVYCGAECQRSHWKAGHKFQCKEHFQLLRRSVRLATLYGTGQPVFDLHLTAAEGRDVVAAANIPAGAFVACPLLYNCVLEQVVERADMFTNLLRQCERHLAALLRAVCRGVRMPPAFPLRAASRRVRKECEKRGATPAQLALAEPVLKTIVNLSYAIRGPMGNLSCVQHALMFLNHSMKPNMSLRYVGGKIGFMLVALDDIPRGTSVRTCYYASSMDAFDMMTRLHPGIPLTEVEQRLLVPVTGDPNMWDVLSGSEEPSSAGLAFAWNHVRGQPAQLGDVDWNELTLTLHAFVQVFGAENGLDVMGLFADPDDYEVFLSVVRRYEAGRLQIMFVNMLDRARELFDPRAMTAHVVSMCRQIHAEVTCIDAFWETLGLSDALLAYKDLAQRLEENGDDAVHVRAVYDSVALARESSLLS